MAELSTHADGMGAGSPDLYAWHWPLLVEPISDVTLTLPWPPAARRNDHQ